MFHLVRYRYVEREGQRGLLDLDTGRWIAPLIGAKGDVSMPPPTPEETALKQKQLEIINQQQKLSTSQAQEQEALAPYLYSQMGLKKTSTIDTAKVQTLEQELAQPGTTAARKQALQAKIAKIKASPTVGFIPMTEEEKRALMSPDELQTSDIRALANDRTKRALEGNLDVDPSVEADIDRGAAQLRQELLQKLGPGAEGSDSWNRAMSEYTRNMDSLRYSVRTGELTTADALATNRTNEMMRRQEQALRNLKGATDPYSQAVSTLGMTGNAVGQGIGQYYSERGDAADLAMSGSNIRNAFWGSLIGAGIGAGGMAAGKYCWIAEALYGFDADETHVLRFWLNGVWAPRSRIGSMVMRLYGWQGRRVAGWVRRYPIARRLVKPIFDWGLRVAIRDVRKGGAHGTI